MVCVCTYVCMYVIHALRLYGCFVFVRMSACIHVLNAINASRTDLKDVADGDGLGEHDVLNEAEEVLAITGVQKPVA